MRGRGTGPCVAAVRDAGVSYPRDKRGGTYKAIVASASIVWVAGQYNTLNYSAVHNSTVQHSTASTVQYGTVKYSSARQGTEKCSTVQYDCRNRPSRSYTRPSGLCTVHHKINVPRVYTLYITVDTQIIYNKDKGWTVAIQSIVNSCMYVNYL